MVSCRTGPLRVVRPLRGVCTLLWLGDDGGPPVGRNVLNSRPSGAPGEAVYKSRSDRPPRSGPVRQDPA
jgi:hypothetical protein